MKRTHSSPSVATPVTAFSSKCEDTDEARNVKTNQNDKSVMTDKTREDSTTEDKHVMLFQSTVVTMIVFLFINHNEREREQQNKVS